MRETFLKLNYEIKTFIEREEVGTKNDKVQSNYFHLVAIGIDATEDAFGRLLKREEIIDEYCAGNLNKELCSKIEFKIWRMTNSFLEERPEEEKTLNEIYGDKSWKNKESVNYIRLIEFLSKRAINTTKFIPERACGEIRKDILNNYCTHTALQRRKDELNKIVERFKNLINPETNQPFTDGKEYLMFVTSLQFLQYINNQQ